MKTSTTFKATAGVLAALTVAGVAAWIYQLVNGLGVTGMSNSTSWGLYITCFMFFVGLSAGGLIVASSASVFHVAEYKKVALPAVVLSTVCICCAGMFVLIDLGGIGRVWRILTGPNPMSPLFWDICVITLYLVINVVYLYFMKSKKPGAQGKVAVVSRFALPVAILVHSVTAWIFGLEMAREGWYSAIMAPLFVVSAMDSGLALLLLSLMGLNKSGRFATDKKLLSNLAGLLAVCVAVDGFLVGPFFWFEIVVGILIPFCILVFAKNRVRMGLVAVASVCVVAGVFFKRVWLLLTSFVGFNVAGAPGVSLGTAAAQQGGSSMWALTGTYAPTWVEIVVVIGVVSLGALAFLVLAQKLLPGRAAPRDAEAAAVERPAGEAA